MWDYYWGLSSLWVGWMPDWDPQCKVPRPQAALSRALEVAHVSGRDKSSGLGRRQSVISRHARGSPTATLEDVPRSLGEPQGRLGDSHLGAGENINIYWSPDGQTVAVGNKDDVAGFIDAKTYRSKAEEQFKFEVNEISWNNDNNMFFLTNGNDFINILSYPKLKPVQSINAHPSNCICIKFDPMGKYFATGSADALVSLWDVDGLVCVRCFSRLDWPVRTLSFSHNGKMLASASEDHFIDVAEVETEDKLWEVQRESLTFTVVWHPKRPLLAFACNDKDGKYDSSQETGTVKLFGLPNDS
ncbi:THO complex subunit 3-like [Cricetulus griseus]|uniref:THO complex subunit 3-like n=1 Tax=Cricetulus griseus TaxID=10029 RepID=UPI0004549161|nr:THO complex subunit 3-like [Cricetulus griseus]